MVASVGPAPFNLTLAVIELSIFVFLWKYMPETKGKTLTEVASAWRNEETDALLIESTNASNP